MDPILLLPTLLFTAPPLALLLGLILGSIYYLQKAHLYHRNKARIQQRREDHIRSEIELDVRNVVPKPKPAAQAPASRDSARSRTSLNPLIMLQEARRELRRKRKGKQAVRVRVEGEGEGEDPLVDRETVAAEEERRRGEEVRPMTLWNSHGWGWQEEAMPSNSRSPDVLWDADDEELGPRLGNGALLASLLEWSKGALD
ncbi:uncharacterized protein BDR25DRAFT_390067 [Lindgomyces ingoldianus]|uniref:Uncharacterized protein n=1 Tax=Lindgomyces ingoldianus TaxID=673940 RepID=A0ACB6RDV8_9PLEO|nr:uncharacterized protein BDR25DRAFT_390067 [Lindgomyces ingoldianus]KAF2477444.1 hypothetical protein BDR25DRAFT_390067 [Lindgomyces ingoldianus]